MKTKIFYLLLLCLMVLGRGEMWATDQRTFTSSTVPSAGSTEIIGNISVTYGSNYSSFPGASFTYSGNDYYGLLGTKHESQDLVDHIPVVNSDRHNFFLKFTTYYPGSMSVPFYTDVSSSDSRGIVCYKIEDGGTTGIFVGSKITDHQTMNTLEFDMEPGYTYYVYDNNTGSIRYTGFTFTPETRTNSVDYSRTWTFNHGESVWPNTVGAMLTSNAKWNAPTGNDNDGPAKTRYTYKGTTNTSGGDALYDGNGNLIEETRGLKFRATTSTDIQTDLHYDVMLQNGASVIVPNVNIGQKIVINGWWPNGGTVLATNAQLSGGATSFTGTGAGAEYTFDVTANGDASFTVGSGSYYAIWSIAVVKSDLTTFAFSNTESYYGKSEPTSSPSHSTGAYIGKTTTFKYKIGRDQVLRTRVDVAPGFTDTGIDVNTTNFSVSSNASTVLDASHYSVSKASDSKIYYWGVQVMKPGTASLTYSFNGTSAYNAKNYTEMFTIEKDDPELVMISSFLIKTLGEANFTRSLTLNGLSLPVIDDNAGTVNVTYSSGTESVATVNATTGEVSLVGPGVSIMKITLAESDWNNAVEKTYKLIVNPTSGKDPSLSWKGGGSSVSVQYNQNVTRTATVSTSQTVHYESADPSIATVDDKGVVTGKGIGTTQILAYVDPTSEYNAVQIAYTVTVTSAGELGGFRFEPNNGKVNNGYSITPKLVFPTIPANGVNSLKVTQIQVTKREGSTVSETLTTDEAISNCDIIRVDASDDLRNNWELDGVNKVFKVNVTINGKKVGKARITVTFESKYYDKATATYDVEVTEAGTTNFSWTEGSGSPEYYTYAGDFMMLPALTGNSNGNYNYSSGAKNSSSYTEGGVSHSALHAYVYERKWDGSKFNIKWNNKNIKIGEGFPDFAIVTDGISSPGTASVFFGRGEGSNHPDTLMVFCETAGDVKLRAYDPQDHTKYCDATIHILPINNIEGTNAPATTVTSSMTYPYTWDFTTNFDMSVVGETDRYWTPIKDNSGNPTGDYTNGYGFFNLDWADTNTNNNTGDRFYKYFIAGASSSNAGYMHLFNGAMLQLAGSSSWANKMDRMRIYAYDIENKKGRLGFIGGPHNVKLFLPESSKRPSSYKIIVKASGAGGTVNVNADENKNQSLTAEAKIVTFDSSEITTGSDNSIILGFADARVYWIAMSTEEKPVNIHPTSSKAVATYSYAQDLDFDKSLEANNGLVTGSNLKAYYVSAYGTNSVTLTEVPAGGTKRNQGLILKSDKTADGNYFMVANPRNVDTYSELANINATNYLVGTSDKVGQTIPSQQTDGDVTYTNFLLSKKYTRYKEDFITVIQADVPTSDWAFYRLHSTTPKAPASMAYLHLPVDNFNHYGARSQVNNLSNESKTTIDELLYLTFVDRDGNVETTAINSINNEDSGIADDDAWYNLQGVRVSVLKNGGIYLHKGKKVYVK